MKRLVMLTLFTSLACMLVLLSGCGDDCSDRSCSGKYDFDSGTSGTTTHGAADIPDLPLGEYELPYALDLPKAKGCDQLDMLFVIDNSGSMSDEQSQLLAAVPGFIDRLRELGLGVDMHVGVVTTDEYTANVTGCRNLGALVRTTRSDVCIPYTENGGYMTEEDVEEKFGCAFVVGTFGSGYERPASAMVDALKPPASENTEGEPWGYRFDECNTGFHRPDSALVVVILTDEADTYSEGGASDWAARLLYLHPGPLLVVGFIPQPDDPITPENDHCGVQSYASEGFTKLNDLMDLVPSHNASICGQNYSQELDLATHALAQQCGVGPAEG